MKRFRLLGVFQGCSSLLGVFIYFFMPSSPSGMEQTPIDGAYVCKRVQSTKQYPQGLCVIEILNLNVTRVIFSEHLGNFVVLGV